tara:strand:+ start:538 stop:1926 length:1389 start_codon:yes stop_codon:yes gene_type:complete
MATRTPASGDYTTAANTAIDTILAEEAGRIGSDIHKRVMHTSPWIDLIKKTQFPDGMGYKLSTMIYDRTLPTTDATGNALLSGSDGWNNVGSPAGENRYGTSILDQAASDAIDSFQGANGPGDDASGTPLAGSGDQRNYVNFSKVIKQYNIKRCIIESPRINVDDLRYAAHRQEQLRAVMDSLAESTRWSWENRYRSEFDRLSDNVVACTDSSVFETGHEGTQLQDLVDAQLIGTVSDNSTAGDATDDTSTVITKNISNKVLDKVRNQLIRRGGGADAYGRENGAPVFALVLSSEASYHLMIEDDKIRQDIRYVNNKVSDLIAPLGVEQSFRGFYHLIDDLTPRYKAGSGNKLAIVQPFKVTNGITIENPEYEDAPFEAAYVLHPQVMESQIPNPFTGSNGITFDPVTYTGDYKWKNIPSEHINPDGTIGFFRGVLSSASKPIKTEMGYTIVFKRNALSAGI